MKEQIFSLKQLLSHRFWLWCIAWALGFVTIVSALGLTAVSGWFLTASGVAATMTTAHLASLAGLTAIIRYLAVVRTLGRYGELLLSHQAVFALLKTLRVRFFAHWASLGFLERNQSDIKSSQRTHRLVKDIDVLNEFILRVVSPFLLAVMVVGLIAVVAWIYVPTLAVALLPVVLAIVLAVVFAYRGIAFAKTESQLSEKRKSLLLDHLPALTQLVMWRQWQTQIKQLSDADQQYLQNANKTHALRRMATLMVQICLLLAVVLVLIFGSSLTLSSNWQVVAMMLSAVFVLFGLGEVLHNLVQEPLALGRSLLAKNSINAMLNYQQSSPKITPAWSKQFALTLQSVAVKAPKAIKPTTPITATLSQQTPCLIMGVSGAGKSTLLHTLAGEYPLAGGKIELFDAQNRYDWSQIDGVSVGFLGQTVDIFDQSLADNLRLGKLDASDDELLFALEQVGLKSWVQNQPKGLATPLGEYGTAISGGQARRIALARLLLAPKAMLLLDEPFAGLDEMTRKLIWQNLITAQKAGKIGFLLISTHQVWDEMGDVSLIRVEP